MMLLLRVERGKDGYNRFLLAAMILALKLCYSKVYVQRAWGDLKRVVDHVSRGSVQFDDVKNCEMIMCSTLQFDLAVPTALDFVDHVGIKATSNGCTITMMCKDTARLLAKMSLLDSGLHFGTS